MNDKALSILPILGEGREAHEQRQRFIKKLFVVAFRNSFGNIAAACEVVNINRSTYYDWIKADLIFKEELEDVKKSFVELAEGQLLKNILRGKEISLIFYLTNKASEHWKHKSVQEHTGEFKFEGDINLDAKFTEHANDIMRRFGIALS